MSRALEGLKVLDLTMNLPGPYMTWLLAQLGAEVVKVENPQGGDYARALAAGATGSSSPFFEAVNRNKKSVTLNLKHPEGRRLFLELLDSFDVVVEGFRPGTMERLDLGYDVLAQRQPRLIFVSISGYGQKSPYRLRAGHDINYLSLAGIIGMTGTRAGDLAIPGVQIADLAGGSLMALTGLLAAIIQRERTGKGQFVDTAMLDGSFSLATMIFAGIEAGFDVPGPGNMFLNGLLPCYGLYRTKDGRFMSLGALEPKFWHNFCAAVGRNDLAGGQFAGPDVVAQVQQIFAGKTQQEWVDFMKGHDACCEPVLTLTEAADSELLRSRGMITAATGGRPRQLGCPLKLSGSQPTEDVPAPLLGQHTHEVLGKLGLSADKLKELAKQGVI
ncbi:MAG: CoA transferase [Desulfomonile sp.]|nr:CoA transferase [Desulfomonile sp.]